MNGRIEDKVRGCFYGAAIGDAMGGPIRSMPHRAIRDKFGVVDSFLQYQSPPAYMAPGTNNYVRQSTAGTYTSETRGRNLLCRLVLDKGTRVSADDWARFIVDNLNPAHWWPSIMLTYWRIKNEGVAPRDAGLNNIPGGSLGWYSPMGIYHGGDPREAYWNTFDLCSLQKRGTDRELTAVVSAGVAEAFRKSATVESIIAAATEQAGPEAAGLVRKGADLGSRDYSSSDEFYRAAHSELAVEWDGRFQIRQDTWIHKSGGLSFDLRELVPVAFACFVRSSGDVNNAIVTAVNYGRDSCAVATTVGAIAGAFHGGRALRSEWIETIGAVNPDPLLEDERINLEDISRGLVEVLAHRLARIEAVAKGLESLM